MGKGLIDEKLFNELQAYCELNELDTWDFINEVLREEFMKRKWGAHQPNQPKIKKEEEVKKEGVVKPLTEGEIKGNLKTPPTIGRQAPPPRPLKYKNHNHKKRDLYGE